MKNYIRISSYQGPLADGQVGKNIKKVKEVLSEQAGRGADFLCFPEAFLTGYSPEAIRFAALMPEDPRLKELIAFTKPYDTVLLVGLSERTGEEFHNVQLVIYRGQLLGKQEKTMLTRGYDDQYFKTRLEFPVFDVKGVRFGVCICHSTSFVEPALLLRLKGARLLFTPHFNSIHPQMRLPDGSEVTFADHRSMVLANQAGLAALLKMVVVRSNIVQIDRESLGCGDSNMWDMDGQLVAAGKPFTECVVTHDFPLDIFQREHPMIDRREVPAELYRMITDEAALYLQDTPFPYPYAAH